MPKRDKNSKLILLFFGFVIVASASVLVWYLKDYNVQLFNPKGTIAEHQKNLIITAVVLMLIIVVPVLSAAVIIGFKFRAGNRDNVYLPYWNHDTELQFLWWTIPTLMVIVLSVVAWSGAHKLDPLKPIEAKTNPIEIQVVSLQWRWLFLYPDQNIATVNYLEIPENTPVHFVLTSDGPMNSFWIPQLGGQIYAMAGMQTELNLMAEDIGNYNGTAAEINGKGFSDMKFITKSVSDYDFNRWVESTRSTNQPLSLSVYNDLAKPSLDQSQISYSAIENNLFTQIIGKYATGHTH